MRLLASEINIIKSSISNYIRDAKIILFGSRVDDSKKGGDIDIYVETEQNIDVSTQVKILASIELSGLLRKVDLVIKTPASKYQSIFSTAKKEGVVL